MVAMCTATAACANVLGFDDVSFGNGTSVGNGDAAPFDALQVGKGGAKADSGSYGGHASSKDTPSDGSSAGGSYSAGGSSAGGSSDACPNGACDNGETCSSCPQDCGDCPPSCPNGACDNGETCGTCPQDCGACPCTTCTGGDGCCAPGCTPGNDPDCHHPCTEDPPEGAALPPPLPGYSGGTCPLLHGGTNDLVSSGQPRQLQIALPSNPPPQPGERLPIVFLWHWQGGSGQAFIDHTQAQAAVDAQRFIAVAPESGGSSKPLFKWPSTLLDSEARLQEELVFFDDMLACAAQSFPSMDAKCVSTAGVSAGGLWVPQLAARRAEYLASFVSMSGGVGSGVAKPWGNPGRKLPALVLWGGACDQCSAGGFTINFQNTSQALESALAGQGHFLLECVHNCCHAEPPFDAPAGLSKFAGLWSFVFDHPYWLAPGESPYTSAIPWEKGLPPWCGIGPGSAPAAGALACPGPAC